MAALISAAARQSGKPVAILGFSRISSPAPRFAVTPRRCLTDGTTTASANAGRDTFAQQGKSIWRAGCFVAQLAALSCRFVGAASLLLNLALLMPSIYMMQVVRPRLFPAAAWRRW